MKKIGIIGAMDVEIAALKEHMTVTGTLEKASMLFTEGTIGGVGVVVVKSGVGKVNAGICVQILADTFGVTHVINTGAAGSLDAKLDIGDILISSDAVYWDVDATIFGYAPGEVPQLGVESFPAGAAMAAKVKEICERVNPDIHTHIGRVASGDCFIADDERKTFIRDTFGASCCEMEGAAVAHACWLNGLPFLIIRAISDKADGSEFLDYLLFEAKAGEDAARLLLAALPEL